MSEKRSFGEFACVGCKRESPQIEACRIYQYRFKVYGRKCPRQKDSPELDVEPQPQKAPEILETPKIIATVEHDQYALIPPERIFWKDHVRTDIKVDDISDLAQSFACHGQIEPIVVDSPNEEGKYEGVCGRLRYEATKRFPGRPVLARVHRFKTAREKREWQLAENLHRRDLTALQRAEAYRELYESLKEDIGSEDTHIIKTLAMSLEELTGDKQAERTVRQNLQIASELPKEVKNAVTGHHDFGFRHALQILRLKGMPDKQLQLANTTMQHGWTVQKLKSEVNKIVSPKPETPPPEPWTFQCECGRRYRVDWKEHRVEAV